MIYPFKCNTCYTEFTIDMTVEVYMKLGKQKKFTCPMCNSKNTKRTFYSDGISIQFKDDGFTKYVKED
jgi:uncharacterized protein (DUF2225 family)